MDLLLWMARMYARFVAISVAILGAWIFVINLFELDGEFWILSWVLLSGLAGAAGGVLYLLSMDGPERFRTRSRRFIGWLAMLVSVMLPTSLTLMLVPLVLLLIPSLFAMRPQDGEAEEPVTSG